MHRCPAAPTGRLIFLLFAECLFPKHLYKYSIGSTTIKDNYHTKKEEATGRRLHLSVQLVPTMISSGSVEREKVQLSKTARAL